jgi:methionine aminopeptidase
MQER